MHDVIDHRSGAGGGRGRDQQTPTLDRLVDRYEWMVAVTPTRGPRTWQRVGGRNLWLDVVGR